MLSKTGHKIFLSGGISSILAGGSRAGTRNKIENKFPLGQGLADAQSVGGRGVWAFPGGLAHTCTRQDASGNQKHTWGSLPGPSARRPPACAHSDTGQEHRLRNRAPFCSYCNQKPAFGKPSFIWKKGKELSGCLHSNNQKKKSNQNKTTPTSE